MITAVVSWHKSRQYYAKGPAQITEATIATDLEILSCVYIAETCTKLEAHRANSGKGINRDGLTMPSGRYQV